MGQWQYVPDKCTNKSKLKVNASLRTLANKIQQLTYIYIDVVDWWNKYYNKFEFFPGYKKKKIQVFMDEMNPALDLILDWIQSSGNTALSVEMMVSYLEKMLRDDVVDVIQKGQGKLYLILS